MEVEELQEILKGIDSGAYPEDLSYELLEEAGAMHVVLPIHKDFRKRMRQFGNIMAQMGYGFKSKDPKLMIEFRTIATTLSYLLNSTSFEEDSYRKFDKQAVDNKLRRMPA